MPEVHSYVSGPKWAGLKQFLLDGANACGLRLDFTGRSAGLIRETIFYRASGSAEALNKFNQVLQQAEKQYNSQR
jgi:hypothetical protein